MWSIFRDVSLADIFSLANITIGLIGIASENILFVFLAAVMDGLDGLVSRYSSGKFGKELDSLADVVSFGVLPALFIYKVFPAIAIYYIFTSVLRLARFNVMNVRGSFKGLPITAAATIVSSVMMTSPKFLIPVAFFVASLMICDLKYPKPDDLKLMFITGVALISAFFIKGAIYAVLFIFSLYAIYPFIEYLYKLYTKNKI